MTEHELKTLLRSLAAEPVPPSPACEDQLRMAFRQTRVTPPHTRRKPAALTFVAVAAAAAVVLFFSISKQPASPSLAAPRPPVLSPLPQPAVVSAPITKPLLNTHVIRRKRPAPTAESLATTPFFPLVYGEDMPSSGQVVRVELPRSALLRFGFPVDDADLDRQVPADVFVADDGTAKAVRFVSLTH